MEDTTYKIPPPGHVDESESDDEVLMKRMKKIKQRTKSRLKKMQLRAKKYVKSQPEKEDVQKSPKPPVKSGKLSVIKHKKEQKSLKKKEYVQKSAVVPIEGPKSMQSVPKLAEGDTKHKKIFQSRMSPSEKLQKLENEGCLDEYSRKAMRGSKLDDNLVKKWPCMHSETGSKRRIEELSEKAKAGGSSEMDFDSTSMHLDSTLASTLTFKTSAEGEKSNDPTASPASPSMDIDDCLDIVYHPSRKTNNMHLKDPFGYPTQATKEIREE
ncbi:hypothetical protein Cgig2_021293 [Carnegiea gigantea]|uniref:Uncharacterized protein n=1 Tax=Carnegiea gigantea TaxID=171969 RepID=A0A9Q1K4S8_9CARY|nr:hypothetical protein Cgig2_021293 [Carnegiea gigantea]